MLQHDWAVDKNLKEQVLIRFSKQGNPCLRNNEGNLDVLFGWLVEPNKNDRDDRDYIDHLEKGGFVCYLLLVKYCEKLEGSDAAVFDPNDVIEYCEYSI